MLRPAPRPTLTLYLSLSRCILTGDSLTRQFLLTLAAVLGAELVDHDQFASDLFLACGGTLRIRHYRNDLLDTRNTTFPTEHCVEPDYGSTRCTSFAGSRAEKNEGWAKSVWRC